MVRRRLATMLVGLLLVSMIFVGCGPKESTTGRADKTTLVVSTYENPGSFNPDWKTDDPAYAINQNIFNKLVTITGNFEIKPDLAKSWEISEDGLTYTFYLEEGVKWHDGVPFTSKDVKYTIEAIQQNKGRMYNEYSAIESVECPDDYTVVFHLSRPDAALLSFLSWYACFIMPEHIYAGTDWTTNPANQKPIGTGPFKFVSWKPGESIELEANEEYFKGAPEIKKLVFKIIPDSSTALQAFKNGEIDIMGSAPPYSEIAALEQDPKVTVLKKDYPSRYYMGFNFAREPLQDLRVRQAIAMAIDRSEILQKAFQGIGAEAWGFFTPNIAWAYNDKDLAPAMDLERAKALLDEAGYKPDANGVRLKLDFVHFTNAQVADMAAILKEQLKKIGVELNIIQLEMSAWTPRIRQDMNFDLTVTNGFHGPDPHNLYGRIATDGGNRITGTYSNPELDAVLLEAVQVSNQAERAELYKEAQSIMAQDLPIVPLIEVKSVIVYASDITGHPQSPEGIAAGLTFSNYSLIKFK
ncbi:MAG TPA: ABC transporter substrate-binding protein [Firmicutes bacterium]|nr:ABC transporter substrate-binding protein [Candidatus Fermentithermobacillaceae bacterium]